MNRVRYQTIMIFFLTALMAACSPSLITSTEKGYYEDLSVFRPIYAISGNTDRQLVELLHTGESEQESSEITEDFKAEFDLTSVIWASKPKMLMQLSLKPS